MPKENPNGLAGQLILFAENLGAALSKFTLSYNLEYFPGW